MSKQNLVAEQVLGMIPELCRMMPRDEAIRALMGKGELREVQAVLSLVRYMREDAIRCAVQPDLNERQAGFYSGEANALHQLEEWVLNCIGLEMGGEGE